MHAIIGADAVGLFYEDWAFLRDQERSSVLPNVAAGLGTILFAIRIDNEELDDRSASSEIVKCRVSQSEPIISSVITGNGKTNINKFMKIRHEVDTNCSYSNLLKCSNNFKK